MAEKTYLMRVTNRQGEPFKSALAKLRLASAPNQEGEQG